MTDAGTDRPFDAILVLSFGGPEKQEDVRPFLENVTRGRGIPPERLDEVGEHYRHFGGRSPLNDLNREIIANLEGALADHGIDLPVYFGNRNWHPMVEDTVERMSRDGVTRALVFATSAWAGFSGCRQYHDDIARAREHLASRAGLAPVEMEKLRGFHDHPLFIDRFADSVRDSFTALPADRRDGARLVFTAHSIPNSADDASGPKSLGGNLYSRQVNEAASLIAARVGVDEFDVVWQSRSGPPHVPWLEPDVVDHIDAIRDGGVDAAVVCPVGFVSDHIEVVWDLDSELQDEMSAHDIVIERVATPGPTEAFTEMIVELIRERTEGAEVRRLGSEPLLGSACDGKPCAVDCCVPAARPAHPSA
ncbi:ferrochelatase [uncultured Corynebacterium sp.]|uniref:ferrochelatase n=1 Tax=uncultured Corynebacterium sp. TaxID=159447 RepID=UPI0025D18BDE|nr:ferrochelatase [uncultured Corynebacterium sp.]